MLRPDKLDKETPARAMMMRYGPAEEGSAKKGSCRDSNAGPLARLLRYPKRESYH